MQTHLYLNVSQVSVKLLNKQTNKQKKKCKYSSENAQDWTEKSNQCPNKAFEGLSNHLKNYCTKPVKKKIQESLEKMLPCTVSLQ